MATVTGTHLDHALAFAASGWPVFPIKPGGKRPMTEHGFKDATLDAEQIKAWWTRSPLANIGIVPSEQAGFWVLDIDTKNGGDASFAAIPGLEHVLTRMVRTPSGGRHLYFKWPPGGVPRITGGIPGLPGIDICGANGYVIAPPSRTIHETDTRSGKTLTVDGDYAVADTSPLTDTPAWAMRLFTRTAKDESVSPIRVPVPQLIPEGQRDVTLFKIAASYRKDGLTQTDILDRLRVDNTNRCRPPMDESDLAKIARSVSRYPAGTREGKASPPSFNTTDLGNSERMIHLHGTNIRYVHAWRKWIVWDSMRWVADDFGEVQRLAKDTVRRIHDEADDAQGKDRRESLSKHAFRSEGEQRLRAMVTVAQSHPDATMRVDQLDADDGCINCQSGTISLADNLTRNHERRDYHSRLVPYPYNPDAECPLWESFLYRIMDGNERLIEYLRRAVGYSLTGYTREQCFFLLYGSGANGKSTFLETISDVLGDYAMHTPFSTWVAKEHNEPTNEIARLAGARIVISNEAEGGVRLSESLVKQVTGGDKIRARFLYQESFEFTPRFKLWLSVNHKPNIRGTDLGIWRRVRLVPFEVTIPAEERDKNLREKLAGEASGILAWAVRGAFEWSHAGLIDPLEVSSATEEYRIESDTFSEMFSDVFSVDVAGNQNASNASNAYNAYKRWAEGGGERPMTKTRFGKLLKEKGFTSGKDETGKRCWFGFRIND